jgi:hypothetical protein
MQNHHSCGQIWRIIPSICWFWKKNKKQNAIKKMQLPCNIITIKKTSKSYDSSSFLFVLGCVNMIFVVTRWRFSGADLEFQVRGSALKKIAPSGGRCENFGGFWCEKLRFYAQKIIFFPILGGGGARPLDPPLVLSGCSKLYMQPIRMLVTKTRLFWQRLHDCFV